MQLTIASQNSNQLYISRVALYAHRTLFIFHYLQVGPAFLLEGCYVVARMTMTWTTRITWPVRCVLAENHVPVSSLSPILKLALQALVGDKESSTIQGSGIYQPNYVLQKQPSNGHSLHFNRLPSFYRFHGSLKFRCIVHFQINLCKHNIEKVLQKNVDLY